MKSAIIGLIKPLSINVLLGLLITACYLLQALLLTFIMAYIIGFSTVSLVALLYSFVIIVLVRAVLLWLRAKQTEYIAELAKSFLRQCLLQPLLSPGYALQQQHSTGKLQSILVDGVEALEGFYSRYLPAFLLAVGGCTLILAVLASFDWISAALMALFVLACPLADHLWMRWQRPNAVGVMAAMHRFSDLLMDALQGMVTLKAFNAAERYRTRLAAHAALLRKESMSTLKVTLMRSGITGFLSMAGIVLLLSINALRVVNGTLDPVVLLLSLFVAREVFRPIIQLDNAFHSLWAAQEAKPAMAQLSAEKPVIPMAEQPVQLPAGYTLRFKQVVFRWPDRAQPVLNGIDFSIAENQHVTFVGPSGAGKSTLVQLITRFIDPESGEISLGGIPLASLNISELRSRISVVSQQTFLLQGTLADNLRFARPDASEKELWHALEVAQLATWAHSLPQGLMTWISERGTNLSGGQRQRLSIARALLKNAPILILDEATANLDLANEQALHRALKALTGSCTIISITHRRQTVENADRIYLLQHGQLTELNPNCMLSEEKAV